MSSSKEFEEVFEKVRGIICENFGSDESDITLETSLYEDLDADSLDLVDLVSALEYEFDIEATNDAIEKINTVEDVVSCVLDFTHAEWSDFIGKNSCTGCYCAAFLCKKIKSSGALYILLILWYN